MTPWMDRITIHLHLTGKSCINFKLLNTTINLCLKLIQEEGALRGCYRTRNIFGSLSLNRENQKNVHPIHQTVSR